MGLINRLQNSWNAFFNKDPTGYKVNTGMGNTYRPDRVRYTRGKERTIVTAVLNRIAIDCANIDLKHVQLDDEGRYKNTINSTLNNCLTCEANIDQTGRAFVQDVVMSLLDEGCVAIVATDTDDDPDESGSYKILTLRTGRIKEWYPLYVKVEVYNERLGFKQDIVVPKTSTAIIENPLYAVMNEYSSTLQRLIRKLGLLDVVDEYNGSGKLDLIIQLPYVTKSTTRKRQADERRQAIYDQLSDSNYGIAYIDGTEKVIQLNRSVDNNLLDQIEYYTTLLFSQLGITQGILDGSADENTMQNYYNRTIEPIVSAIVEEMSRKFLTENARTRGQTIKFFRNPFKLLPVSEVAEIADKMTRNEIMTSNEIRQVVGMAPASDPSADELRNKNLSEPKGGTNDSGGSDVNLDKLVKDI